MRTTTAARPAARAAAASVLLLVAGCAGAATSPTSADAGDHPGHEHTPTAGHGDSDHHEKSEEQGHHEHGHHDHGDQAGHHGGHHAAGDLAGNLLRAGDLPDGYTSGGHHHVQPAAQLAPPPVPEACAPIAELIGEHPSVRQTAHPQVGVSFSKSHYGPRLSQTIIDLGGFAEAAAARERVARAAQECDRYVQSTSTMGATTYRVTDLPTPPDAEEGGVYFRLDAVGDDFTGISWDIWAHDCEGTLLAVAFRSAKGGDNDDFWAATHAAMDRMHPAMAG